jgi:hypothetical protein
MKVGLLFLATVVMLPQPLWGDGGDIEYAFSFDVNSSLQFIPSDTFFPEAQDVVVVAKVRNRSGQSWRSLDISLDVGNQPGSIRPSGVADTVSIGRNAVPYAIWRDTLELRVNGVYAGRPGGNWDVDFGRTPGAMTVQFIEPLIRQDDAIQIRFPVSDQATQWWALRLLAHPAEKLP